MSRLPLRTNEPCLSGCRHYAQPNYRPMISWNAIRNSIDEILVRLPNHRRIKRSRCRSLSIYIFNAKDLLNYVRNTDNAYTDTLHIFSCKILFTEYVYNRSNSIFLESEYITPLKFTFQDLKLCVKIFNVTELE